MVKSTIMRVGKRYEDWAESIKRKHPELTHREITDLQAAWWENQKLDKLFIPAVEKKLHKRKKDWWQW